MIKFLYTRLCFYLFGNVRGDLQNYNATEAGLPRELVRHILGGKER